MRRSIRSLLTAVTILCTGALLLYLSRSDSGPSLLNEKSAGAAPLEARGQFRWYKGNIHTHTLWSDGNDYPEMVALWYKDHGYDFLALTDHNVLSNTERWTEVDKNKGKRTAYDKLKAKFPDGWVEERATNGNLEVRLKMFDEVSARVGAPGKFLMIQAEEISDRYQGFPVHMNATNLKEAIPPLGGGSVLETMQNNVNAVIAQRERTGQPILIHLNHPNFHYGVTAEDLMRVVGENFFEVYNGHPTVYNKGDEQHASTDRIWDIVNTMRITELGLPLLYGLGTDDAHDYHNMPSRASEPGRGWIEVLSPELTPAAIITAMEQGRFYASCGVTLSRIASSTGGLEVSVKPEPGVSYTIDFIGTRAGFDPNSKPVVDKDGKEIRATRIYSEKIGEVLKSVAGTEGRYEFSGNELFVRARVTSSKPHPNPSEVGDMERAWVQPTRGPAAPPIVR